MFYGLELFFQSICSCHCSQDADIVGFIPILLQTFKIFHWRLTFEGATLCKAPMAHVHVMLGL